MTMSFSNAVYHQKLWDCCKKMFIIDQLLCITGYLHVTAGSAYTLHFFLTRLLKNENDQPTLDILCFRAIGHLHPLLNSHNIYYWHYHPPRRSLHLLCDQIWHQNRHVFANSRYSHHVFFMVVLRTPRAAQHQPHNLQR